MRLVLAVAGIVGIVLAVMYFTMPAASLPLPDALGHQAGSQAVHVKHGVAALLAGIVCLVLARRR
ncbi:MAG TPA: hypothetical protein VE911_04575 [Candidatus Nitrosopolaris sp.]|nr:hypothetical protein [Candidatus Nitrosopolaris sp.]